MSRSVWVTIGVALLTAVIAVGIVFGVQAAQKKNAPVPDKNNTSYSVEYLKTEYEQGDDIVYEFVVYSDINFKAITYKLGTADEESIDNIKTGKSADLKDVPENVGKYFADTKVQIIETTELRDGYYTLIFFGYDKDNNRFELNKEPYSFKLIAVEAETADIA